MNNLKRLRYDAELSLREMADCTGLVHSTISRLEMGTRKFSSQHIAVLCSFFDVTSDYLLGRSSDGIGVYVCDVSFAEREHRFVSERELADIRLSDGYKQRLMVNGAQTQAPIGVKNGDDGFAITPKSFRRSLVLSNKGNAESKAKEIEALLKGMTEKELDKTLLFIKEYIK